MQLLGSWALAALWTVLAAAGPPSGGSPETLEGDWQTVIASPKRPWVFLVHFAPAGGTWTGTLTVEGLAEFSLRDVGVDSTRVHFRFPPELDSLEFEGTLGSGEIVGYVRDPGGRSRLGSPAWFLCPSRRIAWRLGVRISTSPPRASPNLTEASPRTPAKSSEEPSPA